MMFRELPLLERFAAARACGCEGVEIQALDEGDPHAMAAAARGAGVEVALVNVGMGDLPTGGPGLSGVPGRVAEFQRAFGRALEASQVLGARHIHLGPSRVPDGTDRATCLATYRDNLAWAARTASHLPVVLLVEPLNTTDHPTVLLHDLAGVARLVGDCGSDRVGILFDVYHATMNGLDVPRALRAVNPLVRHVQFADAPGRHEPGTGQVDFPAILAALSTVGYAGWLGAEYLPSTETAGSFAWRDTFLAHFSS